MRSSIVTLIIAMFLLLTPFVHADTKGHDITLALPTLYLNGAINPKDAKAGLSMWLKDMTKDNPDIANIEVQYLDKYQAIERALQKHTPDFIILPTPYYLRLRTKFPLKPFAMAEEPHGIGSHYVLLAHKDSGITSLSDAKQKQLTIASDRGHDIIAQSWLFSILKLSNQPSQEKFFKNIQTDPKISRVVLQLFFKRQELALVPLESFDLMAEMNPQLRQKLVPIATSPKYLAVIACMTGRLTPHMEESLMHSTYTFDNHPRGKQIAVLFQLSKLIPYQEQELATVSQLVNKYKNLPLF